MRIKTQKNIYSPGELIDGTLLIDNSKNSLKVKGITIFMKEFIELKSLYGILGYFYKNENQKN